MKTAQVRDAVVEQNFWFRNCIQSRQNDSPIGSDDSFSLMTIDQIINGSVIIFKASSIKIYQFLISLEFII